MSLNRKIKKLRDDGFFHIMLGSTMNKMIAFFSSVLIVRLVSKEHYGYLSFADNLYSYINLFGGMGVATALLKFCSPKVENKINRFYFFYALKVGVLFQAGLVLILLIYVFFSTITFPQANSLIYLMILYPVSLQITNTIQSYVRAMQNNRLYAKVNFAQTAAALVFSLILVMAMGVRGVIFARYIAAGLVIGMTYRFLKQQLSKDHIFFTDNKDNIRAFWKISISLMFANLFSMVMPLNEVSLISSMIKDELMVANYKVATLIPMQITFVTSSIIVYIFPKIAQMENKRIISRYAVRIESILFVSIAILCFAGYLLSPPIIRAVYGNRYEDAIMLSRLYWIAYGLNAGFRMLPMNLLPAIGVTFFNTGLSIVTCMLHIGLLFYYISNYGIYGVAWALIIVYSISGMIYWGFLLLYCRRRLS